MGVWALRSGAVLESELFLPLDLVSASIKQLQKDSLVERPGAMLIGISQGGTTGCGDPQMFQFSLTASHPSANFSEGMGSTQLTEEHGYKLTPASKSSGMAFSFCFHHGLLELDSRKQL